MASPPVRGGATSAVEDAKLVQRGAAHTRRREEVLSSNQHALGVTDMFQFKSSMGDHQSPVVTSGAHWSPLVLADHD